MLSIGTGKATPDQIQIKFVDSHYESLSLKHADFHVSQKINLKNSPFFSTSRQDKKARLRKHK